MARGGKRNGSGRPKGARDRASEAAAALHAAEGLMPLPFLLAEMRRLAAEGRPRDALAFAKEAAPYCHHKLAAVEVTGKDGGPVRRVEELVIVDGNPDVQANGTPRPGALPPQ